MDKPQVLLVEDNEATSALIAALLHREFHVEHASDGQAAIDALSVKRYAAILLDVRMPVVDGVGVLDFLKTTQPGTVASVIVLTAALTERDMERLRDYPFCALISKPFEVEALLGIVRECANREHGGTRPNGLVTGGVLLLLADLLRQQIS